MIPPPLAPVSQAAWLDLVEKTLGRPADPRWLSWPSDSPPLNLLFAPADPFQPWDIRALVDHSTAAGANTQALTDLTGGASSLLVKIGGAGRPGLARVEDLPAALAGVIMDVAPVALDAGFMGPQAADALVAAAQSAPTARLAFHLDPLGTFAAAGVSPGPIASHVRLAAETAVRHASAYPLASLFLATGAAVQEAGGDDLQELAMMTAAATAYLAALTEAGLDLEESFARITLGVIVNERFLDGVAKMRAARLIWAQLAGACGVRIAPRIEARASRRMLSAEDAWMNLIRLAVAASAAVAGGADAVVLTPFTDPLGAPDDFARRQARTTQLVLMHEAGLGLVRDPARGAWALDGQCRALAAGAWSAFQALEAGGGLLAGLRSGMLAEGLTSTDNPPRRDPAPPPSARLPGEDDHCLGLGLPPTGAAAS